MDGAYLQTDIFRDHLAVATQTREDRRVLHASELVRVESLSSTAHGEAVDEDAAPFQLVMPYFGMFEWTSGDSRALLDPNAVLISDRLARQVSRTPATQLGYAMVLVSPTPALIALASDSAAAPQVGAPLPSTPAVRLCLHEWLAQLRRPRPDAGTLDQLAVRTVGLAFRLEPRARSQPTPLVRNAKAMLHGRYREKLSLSDVAHALDVSPVYLTQAFARAEGVPLYRYIVSLQLARAMLRLPDCEDITTLAMDLGFSSHSHFSTAFKSFCGLTPSAFRARLGFVPRAAARVA